MRIASTLVQHYFLEVDPAQVEAVAHVLADAPPFAEAGPWRLFSWLDRPAIWAMRGIERTSGLDMFLFDDHGLLGVTDVAELITFPLTSAPAEACLLPDWATFSRHLQGEGVLFATFLWPDWDTLCSPQAWGGRPPPKRTQILAAIQRCLLAALPMARRRSLLSDIPPLLLTASAGDADLVLYGWIKNPADLDAILLTLSLMETHALAREIFQDSAARWPVFRSTQTELAIDLNLYLRVRETARTGHSMDPDLQATLNACFTGDVFAEVGLARGRNSLGDLKDGLKKIAPGWEERAVFGGEDLVLAAAQGSALTFGQVIALLARLEVMPAQSGNHGFPRRSSLRLGVMDALGRQDAVTPEHIYGPHPGGSPDTTAPPDPFAPSFQSVDLRLVQESIVRLANIHWREDVRIIERMIERCVTLQKSHSLRRETRRMVSQALTRIVKRCGEIREREQALDQLILESQALPPVPADPPQGGGPAFAAAEELNRQIQETCIDIRMKRSNLLGAGMALDRALSHHSKGVVALLLHPASQARGSEHIASEVGLSLGMGSIFQSAACRMLAALPAGGESPAHPSQRILFQLKDALRDIQHPTVYASHDPDFSINASMALLRIPRWALWYPSASCHLMHEFGHALASIGSLSYLLTSVLRKFGSQNHRNSPVMQDHLALFDGLLAPAEDASVKSLLSFAVSQFPPSKKSKDNGPDEMSGGQGFPLSPPKKNKDKAPCGALPSTVDEMEEICCDVVARSLAYPPGPRWDRRWLVETFEYCLPFAGRREPDFIQTRLLRLLAAFIAVRLLRAGLFQGGDPAAIKPLSTIHLEMARIAADFGDELQQWEKRLTTQPVPVPNYVSQGLFSVIRSLLDLVKDGKIFRKTPRETWFMNASLLVTLALSVRPLDDQTEVSGFKATQIWGRLTAVADLQPPAPAAEPPAAAEQAAVDAVVEALCRNEIPSSAVRHIEHLPSLLAHRYETQGNRVPPSVRIALSYYLYDNYHFDN